MNLTEGSFLCLDIGSSGVHAVATRVCFGRIKTSASAYTESSDLAYAIKTAVDSLEEQIGTRFDKAFVTGNFGQIESKIVSKKSIWSAEHKITQNDILEQIFDFFQGENSVLHIIPLRYDLGGFHNISNPLGHTDRALHSVFNVIAYNSQDLSYIKSVLHSAHLRSGGFFDPMFLLGSTARLASENSIFIDFGAEFTSVSLWTARGPILINKIPIGGADITKSVAQAFNLPISEAERLKVSSMSLIQTDMDRFTPADAKYDITRFDLNEITESIFSEILSQVQEILIPVIEKYNPIKIYISGGGSGIMGLDDVLEKEFNIPVENLGAFGIVNSFAEFIWNSESSRVKAYLERRKKWDKFFGFLTAPLRWRIFSRRKKFIPIMPSTLVWDMRNLDTYTMFESAGIDMIHVDIMDGFYVDNIASGIDELRFIRSRTKSHLHVHLMTENPVNWATEAIAGGADTIIVSSGTNGVRRALNKIRAAGKRGGVALHPNTDLEVIAPILRNIDEVMIMSVIPGKSGQVFIEESISKIASLNNTRRKHGLKFKISVDGGINPETAKKCWVAGADFLVAGSFLKKAPDFAAAVQELLEKK
ncbi:MAG: ribulose-phosphate 3-epimerase [Alphaproteobacteria bacterium]|jgi:ribulose-phosphate 3-epimerase